MDDPTSGNPDEGESGVGVEEIDEMTAKMTFDEMVASSWKTRSKKSWILGEESGTKRRRLAQRNRLTARSLSKELRTAQRRAVLKRMSRLGHSSSCSLENELQDGAKLSGVGGKLPQSRTHSEDGRTADAQRAGEDQVRGRQRVDLERREDEDDDDGYDD
ncbi:hypothetical protein TI39_contig5888g00001 [Zymoseptoria brevis]|uniref:Uncharacterized protein n=1 Tax=Zymoseptoria brevis TaxID=1047168 RepID=A0A0F4G4D4_9PEZI|nr:hypothetical protein TI39_contig5888g00001 [Zymoseptoria brevis]